MKIEAVMLAMLSAISALCSLCVFDSAIFELRAVAMMAAVVSGMAASIFWGE